MVPLFLRAPFLAAGLALCAVAPAVAQDAPAPPADTAQTAAEPAPADASSAPKPPRPALSTLWDGSLADSANGTDFTETEGYRRLLSSLQRMSAEDAATHTAVKLDYEQALADPDSLRGEWVKVRGMLVELNAERLDHPIDGAVDVWRGWVSDPDGVSEPVVFDLLQRPEGIELKRDLADVEGVLYRTVRYETQRGMQREVPYIVAQRVTRVDQASLERHGVADVWALGLIFLAVAFICIRVVGLMRQKRGKGNQYLSDHGAAIRRAAMSGIPPRERGPTHRSPTPPVPPPTDTP